MYNKFIWSLCPFIYKDLTFYTNSAFQHSLCNHKLIILFLTPSVVPFCRSVFFAVLIQHAAVSWQQLLEGEELHFWWALTATLSLGLFSVCSLYMCACVYFLKCLWHFFRQVVRKDREAQTPSEMHDNHFNSQLRQDGHCDAGESKGPCWSVKRPLRVMLVAYNVELRAQKCSSNVY